MTNNKKIAIIEIILLVILLLDIFVTNIVKDYGMFLLLGLFIGITIFTVGYKKNRSLYKKEILLNIFIYCFLYYLLTYLSGIFIGFLKSGYNLKISGIFLNSFPIIINIFAAEVFRYVLLSNSNNKKIMYVLCCLLFTIIDVKLIAYAYNLKTVVGLAKLGYTSFLPLLSKNIFLTYLCYKFGYVPNIIYRLLMEMPIYMLPIFPNIDEYFDVVIKLLLPALLLYITYKEFYIKKGKTDVRKVKSPVFTIILIVAIVVIIALTCGLFKYYALAVGSNSMSPNIKKGDLVIVRKVDKDELNTLMVGQVLVFKHGNMVIVHRIYSIDHSSNKYYFKTKGDYNTAIDNWIVDQEYVIGTAILRIPFLGIPTVWLSEKV